MADYRAFRVTLRMEIHPGMGPAFEQAWYDGANVITSQPGNLGQWLCRGAESGDVYHIVSDWVDEAVFRDYECSQEHVEHRQKLHPYRASGSMTTMNVLYDLAGAGARR